MIRADSTAQMKISQRIEAESAKSTEKQTVEDKIPPGFDDTHEKLTGVLTALAILLIIPVLLMIVSMIRKRIGEKGRYQ
jgi:hypothetical protein